MLSSFISWTAAAVALVIALAAIARGGYLRVAGVIILIGWSLSGLVARQVDPGRVQPNILLIDAAALVAFFLLYVRHPRLWLLLMTGAQVNVVIGHALTGLGKDDLQFVYGSTIWVLGIAQLIPLAVATARRALDVRSAREA